MTSLQLTDNGNAAECNHWDDCGPQIDGSTVVWSEYDGHDYEIFLAIPILPVT